jgi:hypothetical protein
MVGIHFFPKISSEDHGLRLWQIRDIPSGKMKPAIVIGRRHTGRTRPTLPGSLQVQSRPAGGYLSPSTSCIS